MNTKIFNVVRNIFVGYHSKKLQIKTTMRYHTHPLEWKQQLPKYPITGEQGDCGGNAERRSHWIVRSPDDQTDILSPRHLPKGNENLCSYKNPYTDVKSSCICNSQQQKIAQMSSTGKGINKPWYIYITED